MKISNSFVLVFATYVAAFPHYAALTRASGSTLKAKSCYNGTLSPKHFKWKAPGEDDLRAPCPVMNTLANHGFIPHHGRGITRQPFIEACGEALNISPEFADGIFTTGVPSNPAPNATFFDLDMLHKTHGFIEHDGSLSRKDIFFDPSNRFDPDTFDNLMSYFGDSDKIDIPSLANARARHALDMSLINPEFEITQESIPVIVGENAMLLEIFGNPPENPVASRDFFEFFFRKSYRATDNTYDGSHGNGN
ncbi:hypothetical protein AK830_g7989 [Neonectria ditissima]|uniref:Heme haloperoxidase family profile domain-containing protein n=1 Tax=Neonectria ditissima TaxID=78410 RepID=A0A0N8H6C3_9HYPO|nr:hypothetical protein AK830_g7989 [Neonectria ditissima]